MDVLALTLPFLLPPPPGPAPVVITVDGAGDYGGLSTAVVKALACGGPPLEVRRFPWSHGRGRVVADQTDACHAERAGRRLAAAACELAATRPVTLLGHSAGCAVALHAAECLPPGTLERIVLLAPSVSAGYDPSRAAAGTRRGIDAFVSRRDRWALGAVTRVIGTADRTHAAAAGRRGFRSAGPEVRQHAWTPDLRDTGHDGGHYGAYAEGHFRTAVLPLLAPPE